MNENAIFNILVDVDFLDDEFKRIGRPHLTSVFTELRTVSLWGDYCIYFPLTALCTDDIYRAV